MKLIKNTFFIFLSFLISCSTLENQMSPKCLYPKEMLEKGGIINREYTGNIDKELNKYICKDNKNSYLVYPIPYDSPSEFLLLGNKIRINKKNFRESRIVIKDKKFNEISKINLKRISEEKKIFDKYIKLITEKKYLSINFKMPSKGIISSEYGVKRFINNIPRNPHLGLDIAADKGTLIVAPENGKIVFSGNFFYRGNLLIIDHGNGIITTYSHLDEILKIKGDFVKRGQKIASIGSSGRVTGPHLHFETIVYGIKINPLIFLK